MLTIEIDTDVFAHLQANARPFVDTPNSTLRRLLGLSTPSDPAPSTGQAPSTSTAPSTIGRAVARISRRKAPKAELKKLARGGFVKDGEPLFLVDYQGQPVAEISALISGDSLVFDGQQYSMSDLAQQLLGHAGYSSKSVRGPAHWVTKNGTSVKELWDQYLKTQQHT
ncbi:MAG: hypothetical protein ACOY7P_17720 [Pseudomonadota bacterium]